MVSITKVKAKIDEVIDTYGNDVIVTTIVQGVDDEWGEPTEASSSDVTIKAVSDTNFIKKLRFGNFGKLAEAELQLITKGDSVFDVTLNKITLSGIVYKIISIEQYKVSDVILAQSLILGSE